MNTKNFMIAMTMVAVVSDSMLLPFFPQFFKEVFGIGDPQHVGFYLSATCFTVMLAFPFWAYVSEKVDTLSLLVYTQFAAGVLCILCYWSSSLLIYWILSLSMIVFKGSYLLIYPYVMSLEDKDKHTGTIGLLSVIVHFGSILGAILGGVMADVFDPRYIFFVMASGDFIQMAVGLFLIRNKRSFAQKPEKTITKAVEHKEAYMPSGFVYKLGIITLIFYFSAFLIRPFFSLYWESISDFDSKMVSGFIYAIPGVVALFALWLNNRMKKHESSYHGIIPAILLGLLGLFLQASSSDIIVFIGRIIYGWAMFQSIVRFDVLLFEVSTPQSYATDYSKIHFFQNLGVLISSFTAGAVVDYFGLQVPFFIAAMGFVITVALYYYIFKTEVKNLSNEKIIELANDRIRNNPSVSS